MAIIIMVNGWRKIGRLKWRKFVNNKRVDTIFLEKVGQRPANKGWIIESENKGILGERKTQQKALSFASSYMRSH